MCLTQGGVNTPGVDTAMGVLTHCSHMLSAQRALSRRFLAILRRFPAILDDFEEVLSEFVAFFRSN